MEKIFYGLKKHWLSLAVTFILYVLSTLCAVALPTLMTSVVDNGINARDMAFIYKACLMMGAVTLLDVAFTVLGAFFGNRAILSFNAGLKERVFEKIVSMPPKQLKKFRTGALLTRSIDDVDRIGDVLGTLFTMLATLPITLIAGCVLAFRKSALLAAVLLAFTPVVFLVIFLCGRNTHKHWTIAEEQIDEQNALIRSRLTGIRIVRAFNREQTEQEKIEKATRLMSKSMVRGNMRAELIAPISMFVLNVATVLIVFIGAKQITAPDTLLTAGGILAVIEYVGMITMGILNISYFLSEIPRFRTNCKRVAEILSADDENDGYKEQPLDADGSVRFENVGFSYVQDRLAIQGVTAEIKAGETVAFIGGTGAGKSTLVRLLCGLDQPTQGKIFFGNTDISALSPKSIRKYVSCVKQRDVVFSGALKHSVGAAGEYADEEIVCALADGQMGGFLQEKQEGLDFMIRERGGNFSGGQKQRVTIARALLKDAAVYIFDDSFSALDFLTESRLRAKLNERLRGKTKIIVTQRVSTARSCDKIFVFDQGRLLAVGRHDALLNDCAVYKEIYLSQTGEEIQ